jgi:hypothetical protein
VDSDGEPQEDLGEWVTAEADPFEQRIKAAQEARRLLGFGSVHAFQVIELAQWMLTGEVKEDVTPDFDPVVERAERLVDQLNTAVVALRTHATDVQAG